MKRWIKFVMLLVGAGLLVALRPADRRPVLFLVGDSTMRNGTLGNGNNGQWGWGHYVHEYFDETRIEVQNRALGGLSSRTYYRDRWPGVLRDIGPGDYVIIQMGHNDSGPLDEGRARNSLPGTGTDSLAVVIKESGVHETVYTYGGYIRRMAQEAMAKGAHPLIFSLTPRPFWKEDGTLERKSDTFTGWARAVAEELGVPFVDLEDISARRFEGYGPEKTARLFYGDNIHTGEEGARENARSAAEGIAACAASPLRGYLLPLDLPKQDFIRHTGRPVLFLVGDSTMKNADDDPEGQWGWGSVAASVFDTTRITPVNAGMAGRSARTFLNEGRWARVYNALQPGDYVAIQFGHNDIGDIEKGKARGELRGSSDSSHVFRMEADGRYEVVHTYGWYLRQFIADVREKGAVPILLSLTPRNEWPGGRMERRNDSYGAWCREVVAATGVDFIDMHNISADFFDTIGPEQTRAYYQGDHTHTSLKGAERNARSFAEGLRAAGHPLAAYLLPDGDVTAWYRPVPENKPFVRWWWLGSAVDRAGLAYNLDQFARKGIGGVEITPIYGVQGNEDHDIDFLSQDWMAMYRYAASQAGRRGLRVEMNCGTGWPFGGPEITEATAARRMRLNADGTIDAVPTGQRVKRAAPGGEGLVLNHYDSTALALYLSKFDRAFAASGAPRPATWFNDSFEVYGSDWTEALPAIFRERYGYDIVEKLAAKKGTDTYDRAVCDYRECLGEILKEQFLRPWIAWAHAQGSLVRNQSHGSPANILDLYALVDIPECETYGRTEFDIPGLRRDPIIKRNDGDPAALKFASSAAHLTGKKYTSAETLTWLTEHFRTSLSQCKPEIDLAFCSGVNHIYFHGAPYSPVGAEFPGWMFYASVNMSPTGSMWGDADGLFRYVERCQAFLTAGEPDSDFVLYLPIYDAWSSLTDDPYMMFDIHGMDRTLPTAKKAMNAVLSAGFDADYISDAMLASLPVDKPVIVPACRYMPVETARALVALHERGVPVIFLDRRPDDVPGLKDLKARRRELKQLLRRLPKAVSLPEALRPYRAESFRTESGGHMLRRRNEAGGWNYFLAMLADHPVDGWVKLATPARAAMLYDPLTGESGKAQVRTAPDGCAEVRLQLAPGGSLLLKTFPEDVRAGAGWRYVEAEGRPQELSGSWEVSFPQSLPAVEGRFALARPQSWTEIDAPGVRTNFATARYATVFRVEDPAAWDAWILDLGDVRESARVRVNGRDVDTLWSVPFRVEVGPFLQAGENTLEVDVTNLPSNRIAEMDRQGVRWRIFKDANISTLSGARDFSRWAPDPSGLTSPVRLIPVRYSPAPDYDVRAFGVQGDGSVETARIQAVIDAASAAGGGTVVFPAGHYLSGALFFPPGVDLRIERDAVLQGTADPDDYPVIETRFEGLNRPWRCAFLNFDGAKGVRVSGEGTIDGNGLAWNEVRASGGRPRLLCFTGCDGGRISGLHFRNQACWCLHVLYTDGFTIEDLDIVAKEYIPSSDGIDIDSSRHVEVRRCYISVHDDCISIKSGRDAEGRRLARPSEDILIEDCHFGYGHGAVTMGSEISGGIRRVLARRCRVDEGNWAPIRFKSQPPRGGLVEDITFEDFEVSDVQNVFDVILEWRSNADRDRVMEYADPVTRLRAVTVRRLHGSGVTMGNFTGFAVDPIGRDVFHFEDCHLRTQTGLKVRCADVDFDGLDFEVGQGEKIL